ncbi:MAG: hypothetical protein N2322_00150, partial [Terrimicrobiaceae bacterium]|nr:hypothetical protein [Terrimicrobiaceae bacterium]
CCPWARGWWIRKDRIFTKLEREGEGLDVFDNGGWARIGLPDGVWRSHCEIGLDESGRLRIVPANDHSKTAVWSEGGHWQPASPPEPRAEERTDRKPAPALPKDFRPSNLRHWRMARDNHGMLWVAGEGRLFKYWCGRTVEVFEAGEAHPFLASPPLESARVDRWGNSWLALGQWRHVRIPPQARPPFDPRVQVEESGLARIEGAEGLQISWRPAGEARWIEASEGLLGFLPPGRTRFEVRGLDDGLNFHGPVGREVLVKASSQEQVAQLIGVLRRGPDTLRVAAVEALARHGESARAALEEASRQATHWWIEAALEEIKRRKAAELQTDGAARSSAM